MGSDLMEAVSPLIFSALLDARDSFFMMWFAIACSVFAAIVNIPLLKEPLLGAKAFTAKMNTSDPEVKLDQDQWPDDQGWMPLRVLEERNIANLQEGKPPIHLKYGKYDPKELDGIKARALQDFEEGTLIMKEWLQKTQTVEERENLVQMQSVYFKDKAWIDKQNADGGKWITEYLADVGYDLSENPYMMKMIVMTLFPPIIEPGSKGKYTVDNMRPSIRKLLRNHQFVVERARQFDRVDDTSFLKALS
jgi:hypothetical protein